LLPLGGCKRIRDVPSPELDVQPVPLPEGGEGEEGPPGEGACPQLALSGAPGRVGAVLAPEAPIVQVGTPGVPLAQRGVRPASVLPLVDFTVAA
ncbi:hypothetical protein TNIN_361921, partial [Trichonephila inaurata madagascariensis]